MIAAMGLAYLMAFFGGIAVIVVIDTIKGPKK